MTNTTALQRKTWIPASLQLKGAAVTAAFSVFGNVDHDQEIVMPEAIDDGAGILISAWNHSTWGSALPIGEGTVRNTGDEAIVNGTLFDTQAGAEHAEVLGKLGRRVQWSFGFRVRDFEDVAVGSQRIRLLTKLDVYEASPVAQAANPLTHTITVDRDPDSELQDMLANEYVRFIARTRGLAT